MNSKMLCMDYGRLAFTSGIHNEMYNSRIVDRDKVARVGDLFQVRCGLPMPKYDNMFVRSKFRSNMSIVEGLNPYSD
jgi:hypothetical protein